MNTKSVSARHFRIAIVFVTVWTVFFPVSAVHAETWYFCKNSGSKGAGWSGDTAGAYWTNSAGVTASGALTPSDTYWHKDGYKLRAVNSFGGGDLWIGDLDDPDYQTRLVMDGRVGHPNGFLKLAVGYAYKSTDSTSTYNMGAPIVLSPKDKPFGFESSFDNVALGITVSLTGEKGVGLVFGGHYDGSRLVYMEKTNITFRVTAGLSGYHGDIRAISSRPLISSKVGNVTVTLLPADSDATLEIEGGVELQLQAADEAGLSGFTAHAGSRICISYDSSSKTTGVIRVTDAFSIPEENGKVQIRFSELPDACTTDSPVTFPLLVVPDTQVLDLERFELVDCDGLPVEEVPLLRVKEDGAVGTRSLVAVFLGKGRLVASDSGVFSGNRDFSTHNSALSDEKSASWSDGNMPHDMAIYEFGNKSGYGATIRTPYNRSEDYVFPGVLLRTIGTEATFVLADNTKTTVNLDLVSPLNLAVVKQMKPTLDGVIYMNTNVTSHAWNGSVFTIASRLVGDGDWLIHGIEGTSSPHAKTVFTADNSQWKGTLSMRQPASSGVPSTADNKHQKLILVNPAGLGGVLDDFNYKALSLADCSEIIVTNSLTLGDGLNRGIHIGNNVTNVAMISVLGKSSDFICRWPITFDGRLIKREPWNPEVDGEAGTLSLGGDAMFTDPSGNLCDVPPDDGLNRVMEVRAGVLRALSPDCVNGVKLNLYAAARLALDFNPSDADLKRYGFRNVKTDTPFVEGKPINMSILNVDREVIDAARLTKDGYRQGLITVKTTAAENVAENLVFDKVDGLRVIREDDADTGNTTFSVFGKKWGTVLLVL